MSTSLIVLDCRHCHFPSRRNLLTQYPVTMGLYYAITNKTPHSFDGDLVPVMKVKTLFVIGNQTAIDFLQKQSGNMHVKRGLLVIDTESLIRLPGIMKIQVAESMK
jgi:hypothetical protein